MKVSPNSRAAAGAPLAIPSVADVSPAYTKAVARRDKLRADLKAAEARREALLADIARTTTPSDPSGSVSELAIRALRLIDSGNMPANQSLRDGLVEANTQIHVIREALRLIDMQIVVEQRNADIQICASLRPAHDALQADVIAAALELYVASSALFAFTGELERRDITRSSLRTALPYFAGAPRDKQSPLAFFFKDCRESGFMTRDAIPEALR